MLYSSTRSDLFLGEFTFQPQDLEAIQRAVRAYEREFQRRPEGRASENGIPRLGQGLLQSVVGAVRRFYDALVSLFLWAFTAIMLVAVGIFPVNVVAESVGTLGGFVPFSDARRVKVAREKLLAVEARSSNPDLHAEKEKERLAANLSNPSRKSAVDTGHLADILERCAARLPAQEGPFESGELTTLLSGCNAPLEEAVRQAR